MQRRERFTIKSDQLIIPRIPRLATRPRPVPGARDWATPNWVGMDVPDLLMNIVDRPEIPIVSATTLPEAMM